MNHQCRDQRGRDGVRLMFLGGIHRVRLWETWAGGNAYLLRILPIYGRQVYILNVAVEVEIGLNERPLSGKGCVWTMRRMDCG